MKYKRMVLLDDVDVGNCIVKKGTEVDVTFDGDGTPFFWHNTGVYQLTTDLIAPVGLKGKK